MRMSTRSEKEKQKTQQEKYQAILSNLLKDDDNKYCVDCDGKGPRWASWNLGVFLCIRCAGIHRNLGVHISKVKSINLDTWTPEQISMMMEIGNSMARAAYEANLPDGYKRPQTDSALESFIRAKYEQKKYIAKEWVPPKPTVLKDLLDDDNDKKKIKPVPKGAQLTMTGTSSETQSAMTTASKPNPKPVQISQVQTPQQPAVSLPSKQSTNTVDLIGLVPYQPSLGNPLEAISPVKTNTSNSLLEDFMSVPPSSSQLTSQPINNQIRNGSLETNLFGETNDNNAKLSTKDSIMALYGGQQTQQQFGVPGGVYIPQQVQSAGSMYGMAPQQQMLIMQQGLYGNQMGMPSASVAMGSMGMQPQSGIGMAQPQRMAGVHPMYGQQAPVQQMQYQQMQQQMTNMNLGQPQMGWSGPSSSGHTLSTNLWQ